MFEESLVTSVKQPNTPRNRWIALCSFTLQLLVLGAFILVPLLHPNGLPIVAAAPRVALYAMPTPKPPPVQPQRVHVATEETNALHAPSTQAVQSSRSFLQTMLHPTIDTGYAGPSLESFGPGRMGSTSDVLIGSGTSTSGPNVVRAGPPSKLRISDGVSAGLLLEPIRPIYPRMAIVTRTQGTVVVTATIDKSGRIIGAQAISGPPMLRGAAIDAVKVARYKPYLLNGLPTEVDTTISVNFRMDN